MTRGDLVIFLRRLLMFRHKIICCEYPQHVKSWRTDRTMYLYIGSTVKHMNQRTNGPVEAHLISGPSISTKHTKSI